MSPDERKLSTMAEAAALELDQDHEAMGIGSRELIQQKQTFEEILKLSAKALSNKTPAETLVKLLRICAFLEHREVTGRILEYLKPKITHLDNQEISHIFQSLVLVPA